MLKKLMLLAMAVGALVAFAAPAVAQAAGPNFNNATEEYEGFLKFNVPGAPVPNSSFGCDVTVAVQGDGDPIATVETFKPTTNSCHGTGVFAGCKLVADASNAPFIAQTNTDHNILVFDDAANITILNVYSDCVFGVPGSHLEFEEVHVSPSPTEGPIGTFSVAGVSASAPQVFVSGSLHAETDTALTLTT